MEKACSRCGHVVTILWGDEVCPGCFASVASAAVSGGLLPIALSAVVPLWILKMRKVGGPTEAEFADAAAFGPVLAEKGDVLMYGYKDRKTPAGQPSVAELFNRLAKSLAVLAFVPGGVRAFGMHFDAATLDTAQSTR